MMNILKNELQRIIDDIDTGNSNIPNEEELEEILDLINKATNTQSKLSKYQAMKYLNVSRATFDRLVADGKIPKGKKEQGFKEKFWELSALKKFKDECQKKQS